MDKEIKFGKTIVDNAKKYSENHSEEEYEKYLEQMSIEFANMFY